MSISVSLLFAYIRKGNVLCLQRGRSRGCNVFDRVLGLAIGLFRSRSEGHLSVPLNVSAHVICYLQRVDMVPLASDGVALLRVVLSLLTVTTHQR